MPAPRSRSYFVNHPATLRLESKLAWGGGRADRARAKLQGLLEALGAVVGGREGDGTSAAVEAAAAAAARMVIACPEVLLLESGALLGMAEQLRGMVRGCQVLT